MIKHPHLVASSNDTRFRQISPQHHNTYPDIKNELKKKDDEFVKTLKRQAEDIDTLLQYMSRQFVEMQGAYKEELLEIENAFLQVQYVRGADKDLNVRHPQTVSHDSCIPHTPLVLPGAL